MELQEGIVGGHSLNALKALLVGVYGFEDRKANRFALELAVVLIDEVDEIVSLLLGLEVDVDLPCLLIFLWPVHYAGSKIDIVA